MAFKKKTVYTILGTVLIVLFFVYLFLLRAPGTNPTTSAFVIEEDQNLGTISSNLYEQGYIRSPFLFRAVVSFLGYDKHIQLGGYTFPASASLSTIIRKMVYEKPDKPLVSVTIPEGSTTYEIATLIQKQIPLFSKDIFGEEVTNNNADGKLFPSTYFFLPSTTEARAVTLLTETFEKKYSEAFVDEVIPSELSTQEEVIILASILEGEAKTKEDMQIVAGILLKRLAIGMALQVDVAQETYQRRGLPYEPINNPGLTALDAVFTHVATPYLYYITGDDGMMYYAKTFEEHKRNIAKYLR